MKSTFQRNLIIGFGFSLLLLIFSAVASYISIRNLVESARLVDHTNDVLRRLDGVLLRLKDAETGQRGYIITGNETYMVPYQKAIDSIRINIARVKEMTIDNPVQTAAADQLLEQVMLRANVLKSNIDKKKNGAVLTVGDIEEGRVYMEQVDQLVQLMKARETQLMKERTENMNKFAASTPAFLIIATVLSLLITVTFFVKVNNDFKKQRQLRRELEIKDEDISRRISIIRDIANRISAGDYSTRAQEVGEDGLGNLSVSLNKMASSLEYSFGLLEGKEWLQTGVTTLHDKMLGEYDLPLLSRSIIDFVVTYTGSHAGAFYMVEEGSALHFLDGYAVDGKHVKPVIPFGDGLAGQCAESRQMMHLQNVPEDLLVISHATGAVKPRNIVAIPLHHERKTEGVIELASLRPFSENDLAFLEAIGSSIGTVLHGVKNRRRLQELLEETQSQSEELQAQHNELENINSELEAQTEKLQASEEELKVQQEELLEANEELEEKARLLEERNQLVFERNIEIQRKAEELEQSTRYKSEFLANMSHELRTPLNSILLLSRLMGDNSQQNLTEEQVEYASVIQNSGKGLLSLIDEILDLSKIEAGKMELVYSDVSVEDIMQDMRSLFEPVAKEKGIDFRVKADDNVYSIIETDKLRLDQIIRNLVSNALKFTATGYVELRVSMPEQRSTVMFTVKDTGIGISRDKQQIIFEAFQQADGSTRRKYGGTGLGLSISRELTKLLGGEISLKSEPGKGSEFTVSIPATRAAAAAFTVQPQEKTEPLPETKRERFVSQVIPEQVEDDRASITQKDRVILIVEDDTSFARALLEFTRQRGYKGVVTVRGDEAAGLALQYRPQGILLDIQLPVKDGWEVMEELKSNPLTRHIPVHVMSSFQGRFKSLSKGAVDFIDKPVAYEMMDDIFTKIEFMLHNNPRKVLIVEEDMKHAKALAFYLSNYKVNTEIRENILESVEALRQKEVNCVILDMGIAGERSYDTLDEVKRSPGLENVPIIIFTGKRLSKSEELRIKQYADSIVIKVANSYQRILDEVSLFLHLVEERKEAAKPKLGVREEVLKGKTVLLADDDVRNIFSLTKALEAHGMRVHSAVDGREALERLREHPETDIVLMDMMMPEMDGYESTRMIKSDERFSKLPVIAVTAKAMTGDREKCIAAGASDYISKPVDIDQLLSLLRVWLYDTGK
ncbi:response regulator [Chitinophaga cymbidii]|uniref:histidine kinase n=1 Tax=Chitinophaga cymbidii TaxID=1096750 RepID=A0A512RJ67_9BACT|nr:response regulator [Chitinophaga cymbidii]GEP95743.1 hypothetical protein CCY01nite_20030 [Chitinophaga cymbidii]